MGDGWRIVHDTGTDGWTLRHGGRDVGQITLAPDVPHRAVAVGVMVSALNDLFSSLADDEVAVYKGRGWPSRAAYDAEVELNRTVVAGEPDPVRTEVAAAWARRVREDLWVSPLTVDQMRAWQDDIDRIIADHQQHGEAA